MGSATIKARKATFTVTIKNGKREFTAVNKRAKCVARKLGKRTHLTLEQLRSSVGKGSYKFYYYTADKQLKPIKF